jgi:integrase
VSVILRKRKNADGTTSLSLDIYHNGKRTIETLKHLKLAKVSNISDREENKEPLRQAEAIRLARTVELEGNNYNIESEAGKKTIVTVWMKTYIDAYEKKDKRNMEGVYNRFKKFLSNSRRSDLTFGELTPLIIEEFIDFLQSKSKGEGANSYYSRFKKMIKNAYRKKFLRENVFDFVEKKVKGRARKKDVLILEELNTLASTPIESLEVRRAFLFSCVTGLAWTDIKKLTWKSVNLDSKIMEIIRSKQEDYNNVVTIPLNSTAINLLGKQSK